MGIVISLSQTLKGRFRRHVMALYLIPKWFFGYDIALEFVFGIVSLLIALYSIHIYRLSGQRECKVFGMGFLSLALGYFSWAFINLYVVSHLVGETFELSIDNLGFIGAIGVYSYVLFSLLGLATLAYMTVGSRKQRAYILIVTLSILSIIFASSKPLAFYFVSSFLLLFVVSHYFYAFSRARTHGTFLSLVAFVFIFLGNIDFIFATLHDVHYVFGHVLQLIGYLLAFVGLVSTMRT